MITKQLLNDLVESCKRPVGSEALESILQMQEDASLKSPGVVAHYYRFLYRLCEAVKPTLCIEFGTHTGISAACLAEGNPECKVITVNNSNQLREDCRRANVEYLIQDSLQELNIQEKADILFSDTYHDGARCAEEYKIHVKHVKPGGVVLFDDIFLFDCMKNFWAEFNPVEGEKLELPVHGGAGFGAVILKEG